MNFDIVGIAETHLINKQELELRNYVWYGHNRRNIHFRAKVGSGGVGFLIKKTLLNDFHVSMLDDTYEGILWLKLIHKQGGDSIVCCVCYLPPINSTRNVDSSEF